jgi:hypothetical protein
LFGDEERNVSNVVTRSHPRHGDGTISRTTNRVLKGHTDDVARFIVKVSVLLNFFVVGGDSK